MRELIGPLLVTGRDVRAEAPVRRDEVDDRRARDEEDRLRRRENALQALEVWRRYRRRAAR